MSKTGKGYYRYVWIHVHNLFCIYKIQYIDSFKYIFDFWIDIVVTYITWFALK